MQKRIWQGFLKKLSVERKDIALTDRAKKYWEGLDSDDRTKDISWNGREIRNGEFMIFKVPRMWHETDRGALALQTAIALATYEAEKDVDSNEGENGRIFVREWHFQAVVDRKQAFEEYRKKIRDQDEATRAWLDGSRAPPSKENGKKA
ncbi:MAG: hypothetical protein CL912_16665 [Deltaproteobacteria bacterium]|nr:hypothetical protein [Deltaproteobacteria bacterium]